MEPSTAKPGRQWWKRFIEITNIETSDPGIQRRGQLLALYIVLIWGILTYTLINNVVYLYIHPSLEYTIYLLQEIFLFILFYIFWRMNQKGKVLLTAYISITLTIIAAIFTSDAKYLEYSMVIFALPIGMSSFIIRPYMSFPYAFLTGAAYTVSSIYTGYIWEYNLTSVLALFAFSFMTWIAAHQLESALYQNELLLRDLQRSNKEIKDAYETTLEGWSHALEIRDRETEGHARRVTELTMRFARLMNFTGAQLVHIRRGVLLHDIGKLGIPDEILRKPGPLTQREMEIMRRHPQIAYDLLTPIEYLKPALKIPYYHHEKWDGSGYPHGLMGDAIPLEARIFAIIDVYDALSHDRPYRKAWDREKVLDYIKSESGRHFDPAVVEVFLKEINNDEN